MKVPPPAGESNKGSDRSRRVNAKREFRKVSRETLGRVSNLTDAINEMKRAGSTVIQNKDGTTSLKIHDFAPGSFLGKIGFKEQDIIELIDGEKIDFRSHLQAKETFEVLREKMLGGEPIVVTVNRAGRSLQIAFVPDF